MRAGHPNVSREELVSLRNAIEELGHELVSKHQLIKGVIVDENHLRNEVIHDRDYEWLQEADFGVFEISNPSLGVGGEISDMANMGKPVLCLFKKELTDSVSAYIRGKEKSKFVKGPFSCQGYSKVEESKEIIKNFVEENLQPG